jgi:type I restriction enzyme, S subunit
MSEPLSFFADIYYGKSPANVVAAEGDVPVYGTGGVYGKASTILFSGPAVIIPRKGSLSSPHFCEGPFWASDTTYAAIPKCGVDAQWLYYQLCQFDLESLNEATGVPSISRDWLAKSALFPHDTDSQITIARVLRGLDTQIEATAALIAKQELVRAGLMQDLFTRGVDEHGQLRPFRVKAPHLYHQTELGWLPKSWSVLPLNKLVDRNRPISYGILMPGNHMPDGVPVIKVRDIRGGEIVQNGLLRTSKEIDAEYARSRLKEGDLLLSIRGTVGRTAIVPPELNGANITQDTARLALASGRSDFYQEYLCSHQAIIYLQNNTLGNAVQGINLRDVKSMIAPCPSEAEQTEIAARLMSHRVYSRQLISELALLRLWKSGLMQDLLTGKVSVAPLLERVAA